MTIANYLHISRAYSRNFGQCSILAKKGTFLKKGHLKFCTRSTACTEPHAHTWPINCNTIPQKDTMIPYIGSTMLHFKWPCFCDILPFCNYTSKHYSEFTGRYSPQHGMLLFSFHFMTNTFLQLSSPPTSTSFLNHMASPILCTPPSLTPLTKFQWLHPHPPSAIHLI